MKMLDGAGATLSAGTASTCTAIVPVALTAQVLEASLEESVVEGILVEDSAASTALEVATEAEIDVVSVLLRDKRSEATRRAYAGDLRDFFAFVLDGRGKGPATTGAVQAWLAQRPRQLALDLNGYKAHMIERGHSEATINRRLAAVRSLLKMAHRLEMCATDGRGLVDGEKVEGHRDVHGLALPEVQQLLALPLKTHGNSVKGLRDAAVLALLVENGLRRAEVCKLDVRDFSLPGRRLWVLGKGRGTQKECVDVSRETAKLIAGYLVAAGHANGEGPLFRNLHRGAKANGGFKDGRLTPDGLYKLTIGYGEQLGIANVRPHRLRHSAGTLAAQGTGGDMTKVQKMLRHKDIRTSAIYVDVGRNVQGEVTNMISKMVRGK